jgi:hypothetical protein
MSSKQKGLIIVVGEFHPATEIEDTSLRIQPSPVTEDTIVD